MSASWFHAERAPDAGRSIYEPALVRRGEFGDPITASLLEEHVRRILRARERAILRALAAGLGGLIVATCLFLIQMRFASKPELPPAQLNHAKIVPWYAGSL